MTAIAPRKHAIKNSFHSPLLNIGSQLFGQKVKISPLGQIITDLYSKPVDTHTYLHSSRFHPPSLLASIPKTQFIRLRRICTNITDYNRNATSFRQFFIERGYKSMKLVTTAQEVAAMDRATLLQPKPRASSPSTNTPALVITWHPKLRSLAGLVKSSHQKYTNQHTKLKETFPEPPIVAYKRNKTFKNILVHARFGKKTSQIPPLPHVNSTLLQSQMSSKTVLNNKLSGVTVQTAEDQQLIRMLSMLQNAKDADRYMLGRHPVNSTLLQ